MSEPPDDILKAVTRDPQDPPHHVGTESNPVARRGELNPDEFAGRFQEVSRALWCVAAGVLGDRSRADDLVQDAATVAMTKLADFDPDTSFLAWMSQIVRYLALNDRRRSKRERNAYSSHEARLRSLGHEARADAPPGTPINSRGQLEAAQHAFDDDVYKALQELDEAPRSCLLLRSIAGLSYREISLATSIPEGTAMSHVHRARVTLRGKLGAGRPVQPKGGGTTT
jgi:RNA polymerase sigma-70 factor (ECF subfamily)